MGEMKELEVKTWLNRAFYADKKVKALEMLVEKRREQATSVSVCYECNDKGKSDGSKNSTEEALMMIAESELELLRNIRDLMRIANEVSYAIAQLHDDDLETVLIHRYLLFHTIEQTAELMNYSVRTIKNKQSKAIEKLCTFLPCFAP